MSCEHFVQAYLCAWEGAETAHAKTVFGKNIDQCRFPCFVRNCFHRLKQLNHRPSLFSHQFCPRSSLLTNTPGTHTPVFVFNFLFWQWKLQAAAHCASARPDSIPRSANGGEGRLDSCWSTLILDSTAPADDEECACFLPALVLHSAEPFACYFSCVDAAAFCLTVPFLSWLRESVAY